MTPQHHVDCDGFRTVHRVTIERDQQMHRAVCEVCGPLHHGLYGASYSTLDVSRMHSDHAFEVPCDGRCQEWS